MSDAIKFFLWVLGMVFVVYKLGCGIGYGLAHLEAYEMRAAGYNAKVIVVNCYAEYMGRMLLCDTVNKNQFEIVKEN